MEAVSHERYLLHLPYSLCWVMRLHRMGIFKPWIQRLRPSHEPALSNIIHIVNNYQENSASSHHTLPTVFSYFTFASLLLYKQYRPSHLLFVWAILNAYSRLYLGVHYLGDLLIGAATETIIGCFSTVFQEFPFFKRRNQLSCKRLKFTPQIKHLLGFNQIKCSSKKRVRIFV